MDNNFWLYSPRRSALNNINKLRGQRGGKHDNPINRREKVVRLQITEEEKYVICTWQYVPSGVGAVAPASIFAQGLGLEVETPLRVGTFGEAVD
jgi:hypothetical protein